MEREYQMPKGVRTEKVMMTPAEALKLLESAAENRNISSIHVTALEQMIRRGEWKLTHQGVAIGADGKLYDGQHRLWAIANSGITVPIMLTTGLVEDARVAIDKGRKRSIADELKMFRGETSANHLVAYTAMAAHLASGREGSGSHIPMQTTEVFDDWLSLFDPGVRWAVKAFAARGCALPLRKSAVAGALAFAHKTNPDKVESFGAKLADGVGIEKGEPAHTLRRYLVDSERGRAATVSMPRMTIARKVLRATLAHLRGEKIVRVDEGDAGLKYFRKAYADSRKLKQLTSIWNDEPTKILDSATEAGNRLSVIEGGG